jgi:hypothetical protein
MSLMGATLPGIERRCPKRGLRAMDLRHRHICVHLPDICHHQGRSRHTTILMLPLMPRHGLKVRRLMRCRRPCDHERDPLQT